MGGKDKESKKDRQAAKEAEESDRKRQAEEDAKWSSNDKKDKKKSEKESQELDRKLQQAQKALEKKRLEEEDAAAMSAATKKKEPERLTRAQVEENLRKMQGDAKGKGKDKKVAVQQFDEVNVNHIQEEDVATGLDDALKLLGANGLAETPKLATAHREFEDRQIVLLKQQLPGLKLSQYKEMAWKLWLKSPENPNNQK
eukprot:TRINITY_DN5564_c0_g1_i2.p1 TRINITY_DN5564_c0_g1~~TRINITY_DN5564_c0_g1_i2.p1  ORF type:complete len:199 (+),score=81.67 TRINITY_DN5564_c0_g1_i2:70-666(+)